MKWFWCALLAGVGGLLPTCSKLAASFVTAPEQPLPHPNILLGLALFFVIGAVLSVAFNKQHDIAQAVVIGISAPGIITNIVAGATSDGAPKAQETASIQAPLRSTDVGWFTDLSLWPQAYAQESPSSGANLSPASPIDPSRLVVLGTEYVGAAKPRDSDVTYGIMKNGKFEEWGKLALQQKQIVQIPLDTTEIYFKTENDQVKNILLPPSNANTEAITVDVQLQGKSTAFDDFIWSLGGNRRAKVSGIEKVKIGELMTPSVPATP